MKKILSVIAIALLSGALLFSCKPNDEKLQKEVETALTTVQSGITSTVKNGVVTLTGTVESEAAKAALEQAAKAVKNIKSVTNDITVQAPAPAVVVNPDETLTTTIVSALSAGGFKDVVAVVTSGEVTLTGNVKKADLQKVMQIVNEAKPARVINQLTIK